MSNTSLNTLAWQKLRQNKLSFLALVFIVLCVFIGIFAVILSPDDSPMANQMHIELATKKPFTKINFLETPKQAINEILKNIDKLNWSGGFHRKDIGYKVIK